MPRANSGYAWLANTEVATLLAQLAAGQVALTHSALDELPGSRAVEYLRGLLVAESCLPPRDPHLARYERWLAAKLEALERADDRKSIERFARWHLLRRLRDQSRHGPISPGAFLNAKQATTVTIGFLEWLHHRGTPLGGVTQHDVDAWFAAGPTTRKHAVRFLYWARDQRLVERIHVPIPRTGNATPIGSRLRLDQLRQVLTDDTLRTAPRVAAALVLLFGATLSQIASLTLDDVIEKR
ncbi:hypothetical protein PSU4_61020 [Pseudonocardia sulfidoxydans NBRC 16205]|uniref:Uncharacterized protein n=1 Tax=Pseudonocardia sulfidoxydans NBRC 16205 TaxID=1223511 RepID=A0A511DVL4_9PSEU|nr:hypothetical protein [Pseudonocardia sulfidoxydans]GEL27148.1 hypothetical protein PSU4_61020 [Pseudonocardia sulfidoxydans NBRC 16205]